MKLSKAKKIQKTAGDALDLWCRGDGGYEYLSRHCRVVIGKPIGSMTPINLNTLQATSLDDCRLQDMEPVGNFEPRTAYPEISLGFNFIPAIKRCMQIVSADCDRNYGTVVQVSNDGKSVKTVATDSYILYEHTSDISCGGAPYSLCLPVKACKILLELFDKTDILVAQFSYDKTTLTISTGYTTCHLQVSSVKYPNYKPAIPEWTRGHCSGYWPKNYPKIKAVVADVSKDATRFWAKGNIALGTLATPISGFHADFLPSRYNPKYLNFVTDSAVVPVWYQSLDADNPLLFRSNPAVGCTETIVLVPISA